jgi:hypothetical protein
LELVNGVGGKAVMPSGSNSALSSSYAALASVGRSAASFLKNAVSAVPVYSG